MAMIAYIGSTCMLHAQMYDPFRAVPKPKSTGTEKPLLLPPPPIGSVAPPAPPPIEVSAILNGRAFINGAWYKTGDTIGTQEITYINDRFVGLRDKNRLKMIGVGINRPVLGTKDLP